MKRTYKKKEDITSFSKARKFVRSLKLKNRNDYRKLSKAVKTKNGLPSNPNLAYSGSGWIDWKDFLGKPKPRTVKQINAQRRKDYQKIKKSERIRKMADYDKHREERIDTMSSYYKENKDVLQKKARDYQRKVRGTPRKKRKIV